jgi:hypothetical protein
MSPDLSSQIFTFSREAAVLSACKYPHGFARLLLHSRGQFHPMLDAIKRIKTTFCDSLSKEPPASLNSLPFNYQKSKNAAMKKPNPFRLG